jgi:hypothetical protein
MTKQGKKLQKYIEGTGKALIMLAKEIKEENNVRKDDLDLLSKIGANMLFNSKTFDFLDTISANEEQVNYIKDEKIEEIINC